MTGSRLDRPWITSVVTALLYAGLLLSALRRGGGNPSSLLMIGTVGTVADSLPPGFAFVQGQVGYDGRFYYRLARDPLTSSKGALGIRLEPPAYRQQRILYPLLVHLTALGRTEFIPVAMIVVNLVAIVVLGWLGGVFARQLGRHALWGLALPLHIGFVTSFSRDLAEIVECMLAVAGLLALRRERHWWAGVLLALAILAKEPALLVVVGVVLADLVTNRRISGATSIVAGIPLLTYLAWHLWLIHNWGAEASNLGGSNRSWPLEGFANALSFGIWHWHWPWALEAVLLPVLGIAGLVVWRKTGATSTERIAWLLYAGMLVVLSTEVWGDNHAFVRAASEFSLLSMIILLSAPSRWRNWPVGLALLLWLGAATQLH